MAKAQRLESVTPWGLCGGHQGTGLSAAAERLAPQALTHGTLENEDLIASERFYREVLGLEVVKLWPSSCYVKHPATPWYIVCIQALKQNRQHLSRYQRFTLAVASPDAVDEAYRWFAANRQSWQLTALEEITGTEEASFLFADLNGNWWEVTRRRTVVE